MNSKQRILEALDHKTTDRIPITFDAEIEVYEALYKHLNLGTREQLFDRLHVDTWMVLPKNFIYPEEQLDMEFKTSIWGYKTQYKNYSGGAYDELYFSPLAGKDNLGDIKNHTWPDESVQIYDHYPLEISKHSERAILGVFTWGAYFIATHVRGMQDLMLDFAMRKDYTHHLIGTIADISYRFLGKMLTLYGEGIDIVFMADDYCSQQAPLFSPELFKEFVTPYLSRYVDLVHKHNKKFLLHVCGAVRPLLPMIIACGVDMLEPIQTRATGMEPSGLKRDFGKDICFYGGMDLQHILRLGSVDNVKDETRRLIDVLGKDGGYVLGPGHTYIQIDAPLQNIMAMYETAYRYYPYSS